MLIAPGDEASVALSTRTRASIRSTGSMPKAGAPSHSRINCTRPWYQGICLETLCGG